MNSYISYLFKRLFSSVTVYVIFTISIAAVLTTFILAFKNSNSTIGNLQSVWFIFLFIFSAVFAAIVSLNIFKGAEDDGTELLIVSKPITRSQIIFSKFIVLLSSIFIHSLFIFIAVWISTLFSKNSNLDMEGFIAKKYGPLDKFLFALSVFLGNIIILLFVSPITVLLSSFFGKVSTLLFSTLITTLVPMVSIILEQFAPRDVPSIKGSEYARFLNPTLNNMLSPEQFYTYPADQSLPDDDDSDIDLNEVYKKALQKYYDSSFFKFAPFNVWLHLRGMYSLIFSRETNDKNSKFYPTKDDYKTAITLNNKEYAFLFRTGWEQYDKKPTFFLNELLKYSNENIDSIKKVLTSKYLLGDPTTPGQADQLIKYFNNIVSKPYSPDEWNNWDPAIREYSSYYIHTEEKGYDVNIKQAVVSIIMYLQNHNTEIPRISMLKTNSVESNKLWNHELTKSFIEKSDITNEKIMMLKYHELAPKNIVLPIYITLTLLLFGLVILRFYFRDFK